MPPRQSSRRRVNAVPSKHRRTDGSPERVGLASTETGPTDDGQFHSGTLCMIAHPGIWMMTLHNESVRQNWNHRSWSKESENFSKSRQLNYQNFPCDLIKKMNTHTFVSLSTNKKVIANWKSEVGSRKLKQRTSSFNGEKKLYSIFSHVKYNFFKYTL